MPSPDKPAQELKDLLTILLPPDKVYHPMVGKEQQRPKLEGLEEDIPHESFYVVYNLLTGEFDQVNGVERWLGYSNREFTVHRYLTAIHPVQSVLHNMIARSMYKILCGGIFKLQFSRQRYISQIGLRHYNGGYIEFKKTTSIWQYDEDNRLLAQLNEFTKIGDYEIEPLKPRITEVDGWQKEDFEREVFRSTLETFMEKEYFSGKEFRVLKLYAEKEGISRKELAAILDVEIATIDTFKTRILAKARKTFTFSFSSARDVALYLKKAKIL